MKTLATGREQMASKERVKDRQVNPIYGWRTRWVEHESGGYWDYCDFPLVIATVDDVDAWPFANPEDHSDSHIESIIGAHPDMSFHCGCAGTACIMNTIGFLRSMETFGGRLVFHGCISSTGALSFGTPDDVEQDCQQTLETMMPGGGYAFSPTHCLQDNTPLENVIRMYETVHRHGWY